MPAKIYPHYEGYGDNDDYDDFGVNTFGGGGGKGKNKQTKEKKNPDGKYTSKHIRVTLAKKEKFQSKKVVPTKTN